jgi:uncharacterized protein (DUF2249 family)
MTDTTQQDQLGAPAPEATGGCGCGGCGCGGGEAPAGARQEGLQIVAAPRAGEAAAPAAPAAADPTTAVPTDVEPGDLDLRPLPRPERHAQVFAAVGGLLPGEGLVIANDHDPLGLRRQLEEQDLGHLGWQYLAQGPDVWRVLVSRETCC